MMLPVTSLYAGLLALLVLALTINVIRLRRAHRVGIGDGGNHQLSRAIRVHANAVENIPLVLLLLAVAEFNTSPQWLLHVAGLSLLLGRLLHAWGLLSSAGTSAGRVIGMLLTWVALLLTAAALLNVGIRFLFL